MATRPSAIGRRTSRARFRAWKPTRRGKWPALTQGGYQTCVVFSVPGPGGILAWPVAERFEQVATNWVCDVILPPGNAHYDKLTAFPDGQVAAVRPDFSAMTSFAISNHYRLLVAPLTLQESNSYRFKKDWDRATAAGLLVVVPHSASQSVSRKPQARRLSPPGLYSAVTVGEGSTTNRLSFGPGLEFFDAPAMRASTDSGFYKSGIGRR